MVLGLRVPSLLAAGLTKNIPKRSNDVYLIDSDYACGFGPVLVSTIEMSHYQTWEGEVAVSVRGWKLKTLRQRQVYDACRNQPLADDARSLPECLGS